MISRNMKVRPDEKPHGSRLYIDRRQDKEMAKQTKKKQRRRRRSSDSYQDQGGPGTWYSVVVYTSVTLSFRGLDSRPRELLANGGRSDCNLAPGRGKGFFALVLGSRRPMSRRLWAGLSSFEIQKK